MGLPLLPTSAACDAIFLPCSSALLLKRTGVLYRSELALSWLSSSCFPVEAMLAHGMPHPPTHPPTTPTQVLIVSHEDISVLDSLFKAAHAGEWARFRELLAAGEAANAGFLRTAATAGGKAGTLLHLTAIGRGGVEDMQPLLEAGGSMMALALNEAGRPQHPPALGRWPQHPTRYEVPARGRLWGRKCGGRPRRGPPDEGGWAEGHGRDGDAAAAAGLWS